MHSTINLFYIFKASSFTTMLKFQSTILSPNSIPEITLAIWDNYGECPQNDL